MMHLDPSLRKWGNPYPIESVPERGMYPSITDQFEAAVAHLAAADPKLAPVIAIVGPPTLTLRGNGFAALVSSIISQQISVKAAASIRDRLHARFPETGVPSPEGILELGHDRLREVGLSNAKARYLLDLAARVLAGEVEIDRFADLDEETIIAELTRVKGIGRWTAKMYLIFSLGRPDILPVDDLGLRAGLRRLHGLDRLPSGEECRALAAPWRPYRSLGTWYLWRWGAVTPVGG